MMNVSAKTREITCRELQKYGVLRREVGGKQTFWEVREERGKLGILKLAS
jgi:hypothetical protein